MLLEKALGSWPLAVVICVLAFLLIFRSPLVQLISNVRRASYGKTSIEWSGDPKAAAEQQKEAESSAQEPRLPMVPANAAPPLLAMCMRPLSERSEPRSITYQPK